MYTITMQDQGTYRSKVKHVATEAQADTLCTSAKLKANKVKYDDRHDGMDCGLVRAIRLSSATTDYVITVHNHVTY